MKSKYDKLFAFFKRENCTCELLIFYDWFLKHFINEDSCFLNHKPSVWSVYERILNNIPRTTNSLEGFHRHLNNVCATNHQSILSIGKELINIQFFSEKKNK
jgi:hypothetical protein